MDETLNAICDLFKETVGRPPLTENEAIQWARKTGLIDADQFGACCLAGLAEDLGAYRTT